MKSWLVKASVEINSLKQEAHIISFYKNENKKELQEKLKAACNNNLTHTQRFCQ